MKKHLLHTELFLTKEKLFKEMGFRFHISHIQIIFSNINNFEMGVCEKKKKKKNVFRSSKIESSSIWRDFLFRYKFLEGKYEKFSCEKKKKILEKPTFQLSDF